VRFLRRTVAPTVDAFTVADLKAQTRIDHSSEDGLLASLLAAATAAVEQMAGRAFVTQTWRLSVGRTTARADVALPLGPVQSLSAVKYYDGANVLQTATLGDYRLYGDDDTAIVRPEVGVDWPAMYLRPDALQIDFVCGYGATGAAVPEELRHAVMMLAAHWYETRAAVVADEMRPVPYGVESLVSLHRVGWARA
jgi:uncharacterized phiE125 gp8 family phage protein